MASTFQITLKNDYKLLRFNVEHINITGISEQFRIVAKNKTIVIESNRPLFRNKGLKSRKPDFKLIEGVVLYQSGLDQVISAIMNHIEPKQKK